jgi:HD-GYP domain-containing protein (c-di-GMP phosphodiesterase class II)
MSTVPLSGKGMALPFRKGEGVAGAVADTKEVIRVTDVTREDRFSKTIDEAPGILTRTLLAAPLAAQGKLLGVIEAINKKSGGSFLEEDIVGLGGLAMMGGAALEKTLQYKDSLETHRAVLGLVADVIDARSTLELGRHERVRRMTLLLGEALGLKENELRDAEWGALLYTIARVTLPAELAMKKSDLTPVERDAWVNVSRLSSDVLASLPMLADAARVVRHVYERWDGQGYPDRLSTGEIPYGARLLAVVNAFDTLLNGGAGAKALPPEVALKEIEAAGGKMFDPACVEAFARLWRAGRFKNVMGRGR